MAVTGRFVLLVALGIVPALLAPDAALVRLWWLGCLAALALDVALAVSPGRLAAVRAPVEAVRLGASTTSRLRVTNLTNRAVRLQVRDAWQPSAGSVRENARRKLPPGRSQELAVRLTPTRRGDRLADRVTIIRAGRTVESGTLAHLRHLRRSRVRATVADDAVARTRLVRAAGRSASAAGSSAGRIHRR